jgi:acyl-CoA thioesterase-1
MRRRFITAVVPLFVVFQLSIFAAVAHAQTKVACIGDSITALPTSWCGGLSDKLGSEYTVSNFGVSGRNLLKDVGQPYWTSSQFEPSHDFAPDIVVIMLGTNDAIPSTWSGKDHFIADYEELIDSYTSLASQPKVYLIIPIPIGTGPFGHSGEILANEIVPMVKQVAVNKGVPAIDAFTAFGGADFDEGLYGGFDQVHPNAEGQQVICDLVFEALTSPEDPGGGGSGGSGGIGGSAGAGSGGMAGGSAGVGGSANAGGGGMAGGSAGAAGGAAGAMSAGGVAGGNANTGGSGGASGSVNTAGSASLAGTGGVTALPATSAPVSESTGCACRMPGSSTRHSGAAAVLLLVVGIVIRSRQRLSYSSDC